MILTALEHASSINNVHASYRIVISIFFCANLQSAIGLCFFLSVSFVSILLIFSIMPRKTRANTTSSSSLSPTFDRERFLSEKNQEAYEKLNLHKNIWAERKVLLDDLDGEIRRNFDCRG